MKSFIIRVVLAVGLLASCFSVMSQPSGIEGNCTPKQKNELSIAARGFFDWYNQESKNIQKITLVAKTGAKGTYRIQWKGVDSFMNILQTSGMFNEEYLDNWKDFFKTRDRFFVEQSQSKGVASGFEFDLLLQTARPSTVLKDLKKLKVHFINYTEDAYLVEVSVVNWYLVYFKKEAGKWKICDVSNANDE